MISNPQNNLIYGQYNHGKGRNIRGIIIAKREGEIDCHKRLYHKNNF